MKKTLINYLGLLGVVSLISYTMAVLFAPLAYPNYHWQTQAVSDLSAVDAPSLTLWNQLASLYGICGVVSITLVCVYIQGKLNRKLRIGIYIFALMLWISNVGYTMFPLSSSGNAGTIQDMIHIYVITVAVVLLSIISLIFIIVGGMKTSKYKRLSIFALLSLLLMFIGAIGTGLVPAEYFGIPERFSVFSVTIFNAILGVYLYLGFE
ncbi:DUF998 domain-containing protein [Tetragenococcus koreensis]|uniref:DUF998 domain-containing protein n=1 Tax=Tetragenococcus koreensis TaxID=290335 RepID=UPI001F1A8074|nr:DUF998 domain-containing protein [Tetragenococcus koreensis]MCF1618602.1 DUF998 domain-containing protein [Tetragenococcus koreensis]MCF1656112.1 DUF998 domain-containing protein [Tetragenococcus koreensis]